MIYIDHDNGPRRGECIYLFSRKSPMHKIHDTVDSNNSSWSVITVA